MLHALAPCLLLLASQGAAADAPPAVAVSYADDGALLEATLLLLAQGQELARVALLLDDADAARRSSLERALSRLLRERTGLELLTPSYVRGVLDASAQNNAQAGQMGPWRSLSADHVVLGEVVDEGGQLTLRLRLVLTHSGEVLAHAKVSLLGQGVPSSAGAMPVEAACADLAEALAEGVESAGAVVRQHRVAVLPLQAAPGAATEARLDRFLQVALSEALRRRGFMVVERARLAAALDQMALGAVLSEDRVPDLGKMLAAQSLLLGSVAEAGTSFVVSARLVSVEGGQLLGAARSLVQRANVVGLAAVETRSAGEAAMLSAVAPGWGQSYNGQNGKALLLGLPVWTSALTTLGLGVGAGLSLNAYARFQPEPGTAAEDASAQALALRSQTNALLLGTGIAGAATLTLWLINVVDAALSAQTER